MTSKIQRSQEKMTLSESNVLFHYLYVHIDNTLMSIEIYADFLIENQGTEHLTTAAKLSLLHSNK